MAYRQELQADIDIFENLKIIDVQGKFIISPIIFDALQSEALAYFSLCNDEDVKKYLPNTVVKNEVEAKQKLLLYIDKMIAYQAILYCIRPVRDNLPIGYILVNSPLSTDGIGSWSLNFWLYKEYRNHGIMKACLSELMTHMQQMDVEDVFIDVDPRNLVALNIMDYFGFDLDGQNPLNKRYRLRLVNYSIPPRYFIHLATKKHHSIAAFFMVKPFGTSMPIISNFSTLKPIDRCIILEILIERGQRSPHIYDKLVLAYVKTGNPNYALDVIKFASKKGEDNNFISYLIQKLDVGIPGERSDETRIDMIKEFSQKTTDSVEIRFLNILLDFIINK